MPAHAMLSPSSSSRWLKCPHSKKANTIPQTQKQDTTAADKGTALHEIASRYLEQPDTVPVEVEVQPYVEFVRGLSGTLLVEATLYCDALPAFFGTVDALVVSSDTIWVVDLKTGDRAVEAAGNTQLACYLELARQKYPGRTNFFGVIVQQGYVKTPARWTNEDLDAHWALVQRAAREDYIEAGSWCQYCPFALACDTRNTYMWREAQEFFDPVDPSVEDCLRVIALEPVVAEVAKQAKGALLRKLMNNEPVPGWRLAQPLSNRKWADEEAMKKFLDERLISPEQYTEPAVLKSPAQVEKLLPAKEKKLIGEFVKRDIKPVIAVLESSSLPRYEPASVFEDFSILEVKE